VVHTTQTSTCMATSTHHTSVGNSSLSNSISCIKKNSAGTLLDGIHFSGIHLCVVCMFQMHKHVGLRNMFLHHTFLQYVLFCGGATALQSPHLQEVGSGKMGIPKTGWKHLGTHTPHRGQKWPLLPRGNYFTLTSQRFTCMGCVGLGWRGGKHHGITPSIRWHSLGLPGVLHWGLGVLHRVLGLHGPGCALVLLA